MIPMMKIGYSIGQPQTVVERNGADGASVLYNTEAHGQRLGINGVLRKGAGKVFEDCCNAHDVCYGTEGMPQQECDDKFLECMLKVVNKTRNENKKGLNIEDMKDKIKKAFENRIPIELHRNPGPHVAGREECQYC